MGSILVAMAALGTAAHAAGAEAPKDPPPAASRPAEGPETFVFETGELADLQLLDLQVPTVITAGRRQQKLTDLPYAASVITHDDIRSSGAQSIPDALRLVPGVDVAQYSSSSFAVSPRGFHGGSSGRTLVLVDGRQIFDALFGTTNWGDWPFQLEDIERIEVVRGPGSVTWGANALSGVINIVTRDPAQQQGVTLRTTAGSRGTAEQYVGYGVTAGKLRLRLSGGYESTDGFNSGGSILGPLNDNGKSPQMTAFGVYDAGPRDKITFSGGSRVVDGGHPTGPIQRLAALNPNTQASFLTGQWQHKFARDNVLELTGFVNDYHSAAWKVIDYRYQQIGLQSTHTFKPADDHTLIWGMDARVDLMDATNADPRLLSKDFVSIPMGAVYAQDDWKFAPKWVFSLGGRLDYDAYGGFNPSGRAAVSYELDERSLVYGAVSRAFKLFPSASRFLDLPLLGDLLCIDADRDQTATPEMAYELGYRGRPLEKLEISASAFWHETDDEMATSFGLGPPGLMRLHLDNGPSSSLYGIECESKYALNEKLTLLGNYTFQKLDWRGGSGLPLATDNVVPPVNKFMLGLRYEPLKDLHLSSHLYYVDSTSSPNPALPVMPLAVDSYLRLDLRAQYNFWKDKGYVAVGARNLLDPQHFEGATIYYNSAEVPRTVYAEICIRLGK